MSTKAQILVQLLEKVPDVDQLQRLLDPENLLYLLSQYGHNRFELQQKLTNGVLPGQLLLELLEQEPNVNQLFVLLSDYMDTRVEKRVVLDEIIAQQRENARTTPLVTPIVPSPPEIRKPENDSAYPSQPNKPSPSSNEGFLVSNYLMIALVIISVTSVAPALIHAEFFPKLTITRELATGVSFVGGILAGAVVAHGISVALWKSSLIGIVFNVGVLWATIFYTQARTSIFKFEIVVPLLLGSLPAVGLYWLLNRKK